MTWSLCNVGSARSSLICRYSSEAQCRDHLPCAGAGRLRNPKRICAGRLGKQDLFWEKQDLSADKIAELCSIFNCMNHIV